MGENWMESIEELEGSVANCLAETWTDVALDAGSGSQFGHGVVRRAEIGVRVGGVVVVGIGVPEQVDWRTHAKIQLKAEQKNDVRRAKVAVIAKRRTLMRPERKLW